MGSVRKKVIFSFLLIFLTLYPVFCATVGYVFDTSISSVDFETLPAKGTVYKAGSTNLVVNSVSDGVVQFDRIGGGKAVEQGSELVKQKNFFSLGFKASLENCFATFSCSTPLYPIEPVFMLGLPLEVLAGIGVVVPVSKITTFNFFKDGYLHGYCCPGIRISPKTTFALDYGLSYKHWISFFCLELGISWHYTSGLGINKALPFLGLGVKL